MVNSTNREKYVILLYMKIVICSFIDQFAQIINLIYIIL